MKKGKTAMVHFLPMNKSVRVQIGTTVLQAAMMNRVPLSHKCDGKCSCTTCRVKYVDGQNTSLQPCEQRLLRDDMKRDGYRLACQLVVVGDVTIEIPEDPLKAAIRKQLMNNND